MEKIQVFLDSDVVVASLLSPKGAAYEVINRSVIQKFISKGVVEEVTTVALRLSIPKAQVNKMLGKLEVLPLIGKKSEVLKQYGKFVKDPEDSHIIAAANFALVRFLLTFNLRHYKVDVIKDKLGILVITPGLFLQYLRSLKS